jgi:solute carrier family 25 protein 44
MDPTTTVYDTKAIKTTPAPVEDIGWDKLDKKKFFLSSTVFILSVRALVYPIGLIKTRMQVIRDQQYRNSYDAFKKILKNEGPRGLYKGLSASLFGVLPAQAAYITTYEITKTESLDLIRKTNLLKEYSQYDYAVANFIGGGTASLASASVGVPLDVITQRLQIQSPSEKLTNFNYRGGVDAFFKIFKEEGVRGLYRGYGASIVTYSPTSAVWWSSYSVYKRTFAPLAKGNTILEMLIYSVCGALSGATSAVVTNTLDVAKTRLQTQHYSPSTGKHPRNIFSMFIHIWKTEGLWKLWTRGLTARMTSMAITGSITIFAYENVKKISKT